MTQVSIKKNTVYNAVKTVSAILFPLITFPYINRVLLPDNVGKISFGLSIVSYFTLIASLGITTYAVRECSRARNDKDSLSSIASQIYSINVITTIISYVALALTLVFYQKLDNYRILIAIQSLNIVATTLGADWLNSAMEDFRYITIRTVVFQLIGLVLMFAFVHQPEDYLVYAIISLVSSAGANIVNIFYRKKYCNIKMIWDVKRGIDWKHHMLPILYLFVMILAQTIFNSIDSTMLGLMHGDWEVGIYSTAHKMCNIISQLLASLLWVIMPRMSYYFEIGDFSQINGLLRKVLGFNILLGLPIIVGGIVTADDIIMIVAGPEYSGSVFVFQILLIGFLFTLVGGNFLGNAVLLPSKQEKYYMVVCCITAVVNVIGNYLFIPLFASKAAAMTTAVSNLVIMIMLFLKIDKRIRISQIGRLILSPLWGCIGIGVVCLACKHISSLWIRFSLSIGGSIILYGIILLVSKNELMMEMYNSFRDKLLKRTD